MVRTGPPPPGMGGGPRKNPRLGERRPHTLGAAMNDLLVIGMTIVIFAALFLLVKAVEHLER